MEHLRQQRRVDDASRRSGEPVATAGRQHFVAIEEALAFFVDYGTQGGDGVAEISCEQAQEQTVTAMREFLSAL